MPLEQILKKEFEIHVLIKTGRVTEFNENINVTFWPCFTARD